MKKEHRKMIAVAAVLAIVIGVMVVGTTVHAATSDFDPSVSWSEWFWHYSGQTIQWLYGWFGKCMPDITGTACANP